jgi:hypothetical protein
MDTRAIHELYGSYTETQMQIGRWDNSTKRVNCRNKLMLIKIGEYNPAVNVAPHAKT